MSFPTSVVIEAWRRAGGRCECTRQCPSHIGARCNRVLDPYNQTAGMQWHAHHTVSQDAGGADTVENCEILCLECHKNTESWGGR